MLVKNQAADIKSLGTPCFKHSNVNIKQKKNKKPILVVPKRKKDKRQNS